MHKSIIRMMHSITRAEFEKRLGGGFAPVPDSPERRTNKRFATFKDASKEVQERTDCFVLLLQEGARPIGAHTWTGLAKKIGLGAGA